MPIKKAAMKALRQNEKRFTKNRTIKDAIKKLRKLGRKALESKKADEAKSVASKLAKMVDKAVKQKIVKQNTANRIKSRYAKALKTLSK